MRVPRLIRSVAVCALLMLAFELAARHFGWFDPTERDDPYLGFPGTSSLYRVERAAGIRRPGARVRIQLERPSIGEDCKTYVTVRR